MEITFNYVYFSKVRNRILCLSALLFFSQYVFTQELEQSLLWKVEGKGISPSYIYGTFHLLPQKDFELKSKVSDAFYESAQVVLELDMDDPDLQMKLMMNASMTDSVTLEQLLSEEDYQLIDRILKATSGLGLDSYKTMKPYVISTMLIPTLLEGQPASFEATFAKMASENGMEVKGLETVAFQMSVFDKIPIDEQIKDLLEIINEREKVKTLFDQMVEAYKNEEVSMIYAMISDYMDSDNEIEFILLDRNQKWIARISDLAKEKTTFFGVGAGHIGGGGGIINLLRKSGYSVTPIY